MNISARPNLGLAQTTMEMASQDKLLKEPMAAKRAEIRKLSEDFEAIFLQIVLKSMRQSVQKTGLVDGGNGEDVFRSMLDNEYAKSMAGQHSTGLADSIERQLLGLIDKSQGVAAQAGHAKYKAQAL